MAIIPQCVQKHFTLQSLPLILHPPFHCDSIAQSDNCKYGDKSCWFSHDERNQSDSAESTAANTT